MSTVMPPGSPGLQPPTRPERAAAPTAAAPPPQPASPAPSAPPPTSPAHRRFHVGRRTVMIGTVALVGGGVFLMMRPRPVTVDVVPAARADMQVNVEADAVTRVRDQFTVASPVGGLLHRIELREGDAVSRGQAVATVSSAPAHPAELRALDARVDAAGAALRQAEAKAAETQVARTKAERDAGRTRRLAEAGALAERDVEDATLLLAGRRAEDEAAREQVVAASAELSAARAARSAVSGDAAVATVVRAPAAGRVLHVVDASARVVPAGSPLLSIGDPRSLEVVADVLSSDAAALRPGQRVTLRNWGGGVLRGTIRLVNPSARTRVSALGVEEQRLGAIIDLDETPPALGDGYRLDASMTVWSGKNVLTIPAGALLQDARGAFVYAVRDGRAVRQPITLGHVGGGLAEVRGGLQPGEAMILFPSEEIRDGTRVTPSR